MTPSDLSALASAVSACRNRAHADIGHFTPSNVGAWGRNRDAVLNRLVKELQETYGAEIHRWAAGKMIGIWLAGIIGVSSQGIDAAIYDWIQKAREKAP